MEFSDTEITFYAIAFIVAGLSSLARIWRDNEPIRGRVVIGRVLSSGFFGAGAIALLIGRYPDSGGGSGPFYHLAIAAFVGYLSRDFQDQILNRLAKWITKRLGPDDDDKRPTQ
jgi:hypothetical protein